MMLSIILPVYNMESLLQECMDSLILSVGSADVEIILVNDGSTDESGRICDRYAAADPRICVVHRSNGGVAAARNAGLELATGDYIAWVDPDDLVALEWYPEIARVISQYHPDVIVMDSVRFDAHSETPDPYCRPGGIIPAERFLADVLADARIQSRLHNKVVRRDFWEGIRFEPALRILEDYDIIYPLLKDVSKVFHINIPLYCYRQHEYSLLHQVSIDQAFSGVYAGQRRLESLPECCRQEGRVALAIQEFMFCRYCILTEDYGQAYYRHLNSIRTQLPFLLCHEQPTFSWKMKFLLLAMEALKPLLRLKIQLTKKGRG